MYYLSDCFFDLLKTTIGNSSNKIILSNQILKYIEDIYRDVSGYDMSFDENNSLCRE